MNGSRSVLLLMMASFLVYSLGSTPAQLSSGDPRHRTQVDKLAFTVPAPQQLAAWGALTFILLIGSDLESTAELSSAMAMLILIVVLITYGESLFNRLSNTVGKG